MKRLLLLFAFALVLTDNFADDKIYKIIAQLPGPRQMYGSVVLGDYIYLIGGNNQGKGDSPEGYTTDVERAMIKPDGTLASWGKTTPLSSSRSYINNSTIALNDVVYIGGGYDGKKDIHCNNIMWTRPLPNGHLENWRESVSFPGEGVSCTCVVATPGYIHIIGGSHISGAISSLVWSATVAADGSITGWEKGNQLPTPLWFHCAGIAGGRVWVWGGLTSNDNNSTNRTVFSAPILASGKIGQWSASNTQLQMPFYSASGTVCGAYLLSFCPRYTGGNFSNDIWFAAVTPQGLSPWIKQTTDMNSKLFVGVATDYRRDFVYIPGGRINQIEEETSLDKNVYFFTLKRQAASDSKSENIVKMETTTPGAQDSQTRLSYMQQKQPPIQSLTGFIPYENARTIALQQKKPMVVYLYHTKTKKCLEQAQILQTFNPINYGGNVIFAEMDTINFPQFAQQYGIFKIPCWLFFDSNGSEKSRNIGVLQLNELDSYIKQILR